MTLLFYGLIALHAVLIGLIIWSLIFDSQAAPARIGERQMIGPSRSILWCAVILTVWALVGLALLGHGIWTGTELGTALIVGIPLTLSAGAVAIVTFYRYRRNRILWDDTGVEVSSWFGTPTHHTWSDLKAAFDDTGDHRLIQPPEIPTRFRMRQFHLVFATGSVIAAPNMTGYAGFVADARRIALSHGITPR